MEIKFGYKVKPKKLFDGEQYIFEFSNGYGASVIKRKGSYGFEKGLWELAVFNSEGLNYDTEITDDVIGHMTDEDVENTLKRIELL